MVNATIPSYSRNDAFQSLSREEPRIGRGAYATVCAIADQYAMLPIDEERDSLRQFVAAQTEQAHILACVGWPLVKAFSSNLFLLTPAALTGVDTAKSNNLDNTQHTQKGSGAPKTRQSSFILGWLKLDLIKEAEALKTASAPQRQKHISALQEGILAYDYNIMMQIGDVFVKDAHEGSWDGASMATTMERKKAYEQSVRVSRSLVDVLFRTNVRIVLEAVEKISRHAPHLRDEAVTWAQYGLLSTIYRYWLGQGETGADTRLYTYASDRINYFLTRFLQKDKAGDIRLSANHLEKRTKLRKAAVELKITLSPELSSADISALSEETGITEESVRSTLRNEIHIESFSALAVASGADIWEPIPEGQRPTDQIDELSSSIDLSHLPNLLRQIRDMDAVEQFALAIEYNAGNCAEAALAVYEQRRTKLASKMTYVMVAPSARKQRLQIRIQRLG